MFEVYIVCYMMMYFCDDKSFVTTGERKKKRKTCDDKSFATIERKKKQNL